MGVVGEARSEISNVFCCCWLNFGTEKNCSAFGFGSSLSQAVSTYMDRYKVLYQLYRGQWERREVLRKLSVEEVVWV